MLDWLRSLGGGRIKRLARAIASVGVPMQADASALAEVERVSGAPVPGRITDFLSQYQTGGISLFDPEHHAQHSPALAQLLTAIEKEFVPLGAIGPAAEDLAAGRAWWYLVFRGKPGVKRFLPWDRHLAVRLSQGEEPISQAEARYAIALPPSYRHLLCVFDQVLHSSLNLHEGIIGPEAGAGVQSFEGELGYIREWFSAAGQLAETPREKVEEFLPFYADPYGNEYLFARRDPCPVFQFDHETCAIAETACHDFDSFFAALLSGHLG